MKKFLGIVTAVVLAGGLSAFGTGALHASPGSGDGTQSVALPYCRGPHWCSY